MTHTHPHTLLLDIHPQFPALPPTCPHTFPCIGRFPESHPANLWKSLIARHPTPQLEMCSQIVVLSSHICPHRLPVSRTRSVASLVNSRGRTVRFQLNQQPSLSHVKSGEVLGPHCSGPIPRKAINFTPLHSSSMLISVQCAQQIQFSSPHPLHFPYCCAQWHFIYSNLLPPPPLAVQVLLMYTFCHVRLPSPSYCPRLCCVIRFHRGGWDCLELGPYAQNDFRPAGAVR